VNQDCRKPLALMLGCAAYTEHLRPGLSNALRSRTALAYRYSQRELYHGGDLPHFFTSELELSAHFFSSIQAPQCAEIVADPCPAEGTADCFIPGHTASAGKD